MLQFSVHCKDMRGPWSWQGSAWVSRSSWITPLQLPILDSRMSQGGGSSTISARENRPGGDSVDMHVDALDRSIVLNAGTGGTAPLYLGSDGERLVGSWDPAELASFARVTALSPMVVARLLTRGHRYSSETLFSTITRLTAGATITWRPGDGLSVRYPMPAEHPAKPRRLRPGADPVTYLGALLDQATADVCERHPGALGVELSGGLDSTNVALSVRHRSPAPVLSAGLIVAGPIGHAQTTRRRMIVKHLGLRDIEIAAADHLPLAPHGPRTPRRPHYPDGDVYLEAFDALRAAIRESGAQVVFTGFGGDEIMSLAPDERASPTRRPRLPPWLGERALDALADVEAGCSPVTAVALPTLVVFAARNPAYLRAGLWPIAPFAFPELSRFGRSLPVEWRNDKELLRLRLTRAGLPQSVTHPPSPESFAATMRAALQRHAPTLLADMLDHSPLIDGGFIRQPVIESLHRQARAGHPPPPLLYDTLALDIGIRSMTADTVERRNTCTPSTPNR